MEQESFEDGEVAAYLNDNFISVKVDKEERPDIDAVYMGVCQALNESGGWPLTILMTPEQKPFFAGTYFPKHSRYGHPGLMQLLGAVKEKWDADTKSLIDYGNKISGALSGAVEAKAIGYGLDREQIEKAASRLKSSYDKKYGGFGAPPKFPMPHNLIFLMRCHNFGVSGGLLEIVEHTLTQMYKGGIFDHIGGGFARYSTDEKWLEPHFEKMLYDNALLVMALLECWQLTDNPLYKGIAEKTLSYIKREMVSPKGGFYSAQDADSEGEEGLFYTFTPAEIVSELGPENGGAFCKHYDITDKGNFHGKNIPNLIGRGVFGMPDAETEKAFVKLRSYRQKRYPLHKDDKILASWNALMIAAYAKAYRATGNKEYLEIAERAYNFIRQSMTDSSGGLYISYRDGRAKGGGLLDDYAFFAWCCLELYDATFSIEYLEQACSPMQIILDRFSDTSGGFFLSPENGEKLIFRPKEQFDGAVPSGNSVAAWCLARLAALTGQPKWRQAAIGQLDYFAEIFNRYPTSCTFALTALMQEVYPSSELVCVVAPGGADESILARELGRVYRPYTAVLVKTESNGDRLSKIAPFTGQYTSSSGHEFAFYLCRGQSCSAPIYDLEEVKRRLTDRS